MKQNGCFPGRSVRLSAWLLVLMLILPSCGMGADTSAPSSPLLSVGGTSTDSVRLTWSGAYDDTGVASYQVYRDGKRIAIVDRTEYTDRGVTAGAAYTYTVVAIDGAGNRSDDSAPGYATIPAAKAQGGSASGTSDGSSTSGTGASKGTGADIQDLSRSTVKVYIIDNEYSIVGTGSGTILDKDGFILTNAHCVSDENGLYNRDGYVGIALTDDVRAYSQPQYLARVMAQDTNLDLAVIQLAASLDGSPLSTMPSLSPTAIGDPDALRLGDDINVLGFPGVGGETITYTSGKVSGFIDEDQDGLTDWIKTDALVNHGNSGGTAIDAAGLMVGVPTAKIGGEDNDQMFFLRPVNRAAALIDQARNTARAGGWAMSDGAAPDGTGGTGSLQTPTPDNGQTGNTVAVAGTVVDADTGKPLKGALVVLLNPGVSVDAWLENQDDAQVAATGETDADGWFETEPEFPSGSSHGVLIWLDGYELISIDDGISFTPDEAGLYDIGEVYLSPLR